VVLPGADSPELRRGNADFASPKIGGKKKGARAARRKSPACAQQGAPVPSGLIINTYNTAYDVVAMAASALGFKERRVDPGLCPNPWLLLDGDIPGPTSFSFLQFQHFQQAAA